MPLAKAVFHDKDGSIAGVPDSYIVIDNGIADDPEHCQIKPDWNAAVCKGDMGRMQIGAGGAGGRGGPGAPAAILSPGDRSLGTARSRFTRSVLATLLSCDQLMGVTKSP